MTFVFDLQHSFTRATQRSRKGIGTYSSILNARSTVIQLKDKPGFSNPRGKFLIFSCKLDFDYTPDGYDIESLALENQKTDENTSYQITQLKQVFRVYNMHTSDAYEYDDDFVMVGYYSSMANAEVAVTKIKNLPHLNTPNRRSGIDVAVLNRDSWTSGFISGEEALEPFR